MNEHFYIEDNGIKDVLTDDKTLTLIELKDILNDLYNENQKVQEYIQENKRLSNIIIDLTHDLAKLKSHNNFLLDVVDRQHQLLIIYYNRLYETEDEGR